jgi:hypothetical protein
MTSRKQQQADLIFKFGVLIGPLLDIVNNPTKYTSEMRSRLRAKYMSDINTFKEQVQNFVYSEEGYSYEIEWRKIQGEISGFSNNTLKNDFDDITVFAQKLELYHQAVSNEIISIPTSSEAEVFGATSPFTTYCFLQDLCRTVQKRFVLVDRYLDESIYYRYLRHLPDTVKVTLVTWPSTKYKANAWTQLMDISRLYATEHPSTYRLMTHDAIHDRWLWCDSQIYAPGGSLKDAGVKSNFTLPKVELPTGQTNPINQLRNTAQELFGTLTPQHP